MGVKTIKTKKGVRYRVYFTDELGNEIKRMRPKGTTKDEAEGFLRDQKVKVERIKEGLEVRQRNPERLTLRDVTDRWFKAKKRDPRDEAIVRAHVLRTALADVPLDRITTARINAHLAALRPSPSAKQTVKELSAGSRNHVRKHLISIFKLAIARGWLTGENPARLSERSKVERKTLVTLTPTEAMAVVAAAPFPWSAIIACGLLGLRRGEIWGLNVEDVDRDAWVLRVRRSHERPTKSGRERVVPVHPAFRPLIESAIQDAKGDVLFPATKKGKRRSAKTKGTREFRKALAIARVARRIRFHDSRHSAATIMIQSGATLHHVKDVLGHASIAITSDTYGHLVVDDLRQAVDRMPFKFADHTANTAPSGEK